MANITNVKKQQVGVWANGAPIFEEENEKIKQLLGEMPHAEVAPNAGLAANQVPWLVWKGKLYSKSGADQHLVMFARKHLEGVKGADKIGSPAVHLLSHAGPSIAKYILDQFFPGHSGEVSEIVAKLITTMPKREDGPSMPKHHGLAYTGSYSGSAYHTGGCGQCSGKFIGSGQISLEALANYRQTLNSSIKEKIMDAVIASASTMGVAVSGSSRDEKVESVIRGLGLAAGKNYPAENFGKICVGIAKAVNAAYGELIINPNMPPVAICEQLSEFLVSLVAGMRAEFLAVYTDVKRIIQNLEILRHELDESRGLVKRQINASREPGIIQASAKYLEIENDIAAEVARQLEMLKNLVNVNLAPNEQILAEMLKSSEDYKSFVAKISRSPTGDSRSSFSQAISKVLNGQAVTAASARLVEANLRALGISLEEYARLDTTEKLRGKIAEKLATLDPNDPKTTLLVSAANFIAKSAGHHNLILDKLQQLKSGSGPDDYSAGPFEKQVATRAVMQKLIFDGFAKEISSLFDSFISAVDKMTEQIGKQIPVTAELERFIEHLSDYAPSLDIAQKKNTYFALIGFYKDALSREKKDVFIRDLSILAKHLAVLVDAPENAGGAELIRNVKTTVESMYNIVSKYSDSVAAKFGRGGEYDGGCDKSGYGEIHGSGILKEYKDLVKGIPHVTIRKRKNIGDVVDQSNYRFRVAQIKENLLAEKEELATYSADYTSLVTKTIAKKLEQCALDASKSRDIIAAVEKELEGIKEADIKALVTGGVTLFDEISTKEKCSKTIAEISSNVTNMFNVKKKFWTTVEAIDAYMHVFSDAIITHPDDVKEITAMLSGVDIVADWYEESTGDAIAAFFDLSPSGGGGSSLFYSADSIIPAVAPEGDGHYYTRVVLPGDVSIPNTPSNYKAKLDSIKKIFDNFLALKNVLNTYINVGRQFGDTEIHTKVFMTPMQIYNNLVEFICVSSVGLGYKAFTSTNSSAGMVLDNIVVKLGACSPSAIDDDEGLCNFDEERQYFAMIMKCLAAKILTVTGTYEVFNHSSEYLSLRPVRMILGADDTTPKIETEAAELYFRLPLLAAYYNRLFGWDKNEPGYIEYNELPRKHKSVKITMVPDVNGVFSGLINIMFRRVDNIEPNNFNDAEVKDIIREVNVIYHRLHSAHPSDVTRGIIRDFVKEVNRRFTIVSEEERNKYEVMRGELYDYQRNYDEAGNTVYAILPGEEESAIWGEKKLKSPAEMLASSQSINGLNLSPLKESKFGFTDQYREIVEEFRTRIDEVSDMSRTDNKAYSPGFRSIIKNARVELTSTTDEDKRFRIVSRLIRGSEYDYRVSGVNCIALHETVITGLNLLSCIHTMLANFKNTILAIDVYDFILILKDKIPTGTLFDQTQILGVISRYIEDESGVDILSSKYLLHYYNAIQISGTTIREPTLKDIKPSDFKSFTSMIGNFNFSNVLYILLETVVGLNCGSDGLVSISFENDRFQINHGRLRELIERIFTDVSSAIDILRPHFSSDTLHKYVDKKTPGSLYWLREQLMEKIIIGRKRMPKGGKEPRGGGTTRKYETLDNLAVRINNLYGLLKAAGQTNPAIFKDTYQFLISVHAPVSHLDDKTTDSPTVSDIIHNPYDEILFHHDGKNKIADLRVVPRFEQFYKWDNDLTVNRSCVTMFNQIIAKFIYSFYDPMTSKIYNGLIAPFANTFTRSLTNHAYTYPDVSPAMYVTYKDPTTHLNAASVLENTINLMLTDRLMYGDINIDRSKYRYVRSDTKSLSSDDKVKYGRADDDVAFAITNVFKLYFISAIREGKFNSLIPLATWFPEFEELLRDPKETDSAVDYIIDAPMEWYSDLGSNVILNDHIEIVKGSDHVPQTDVNTRAAYDELIENNEIKKLDGAYIAKNAIWSDNATLNDAVKKKVNDALTHQGTVPTPADLIWYNEGVDYITEIADLLEDTTNAPLLGVGAVKILEHLAFEFMLGLINVSGFVPEASDVGLPTTDEVISFPNDLRVALTSVPVDYAKLVRTYVTMLQTYRDVNMFADSDNVRDSIVDLLSQLSKSRPGSRVGGFPSEPGRFIADLSNIIRAFGARGHVTPNDVVNEISRYMVEYPFEGVGKTDYERDIWDLMIIHGFYICLPFISGTYHLRYPLNTDRTEDRLRTEINNAIAKTRTLFGSTKLYSPVQGKDTPIEYLIDYDTYRLSQYGSLDSDIDNSRPDSPHILFAREELIVNGASNTISHLGYAEPSDPKAIKKLADILSFKNRADADADHVLFTSLAARLGNLVRPAITAEKSRLVDNVADIPGYMKEKIRANAPIFVQMLKALINKSRLLGKFIGSGSIKVYKSSDNNIPWPWTTTPLTNVSDNNRRYIGVLDSIINGCNSLITGCEHTLREIGDDPKFLEVYQHSSRDYKSANGIEPFMPLSSALYALQNYTGYTNTSLLPVYSLGDINFKFAYGVRGLLNRTSSKDSSSITSGLGNTLEGFNMSSDSGKFAPEKIDNMSADYIAALRFLHGIRNYNGVVSGFFRPNRDKNAELPKFKKMSFGQFTRHDMVFTVLGTKDTSDISNKNRRPHGLKNTSVVSIVPKANPEDLGPASYALVKKLPEILGLTESAFHDDVLKVFVKFVCTSKDSDEDRYIRNILDLGIVPINVHALRREVPLVNVYNYAYTYDRMIYEMYVKIINRISLEDLRDPAKSIGDPNQILLALLLDPYFKIKDDNWNTATMMLAGIKTNKNYSRPKFLSDQLLGKALLSGDYPVGRITDTVPGVDHGKPYGSPLMYVDKYDTHKASTAAFDEGKTHDRFNTYITRILIFIVNLQRSIRAKLHDDLMYVPETAKIINSLPVSNNNVTEFFGFESSRK